MLQHFGRHAGARHRGRAEHRRFTADQQNFAKLHDRPDIAGDLAYLEHIIRNDAVLPAAGFDDCEHRFIPSCSIPASAIPIKDCPGRLFLQSLWVQLLRDPGAIPLSRAKINSARKIPRRVAGTYSPPGSRVKAKRGENGPKMRDLAHFWPAGPVMAPRHPACETNGFPSRCPAIPARQGQNG